MSINQLVQKHQGYLFKKANHIATNEEEAKDLAQDAIVRIIEQANKYDENRNFKAWSLQVMRNLYINQYNRRKRYRVFAKPTSEIMPLVANTKNAGESNLNVAFLNTAISHLKRPHRKAFQLFYEGYEQKEIADRFKIPVGTVKYHIYMAKKELQSIVRKYFS